MPLSNLLIILAVGTFIATLVVFPSFRGKLKVLVGGFLNIFVEDRAKTPEGAAAIYSQAVEEAQEKYSRADDTLRRITGRLQTAANSYNTALKDIKVVEDKARAAMNRGDEKTARIYAEKRQELILSSTQYKDTIEKLTPAAKQAKEIFEQRERELADIKRKKVEVVEQLRTNQDVEAAYDDLDELKRDSASKKLLEVIDDECKEGSERAAGARIVHEAKLSTRVSEAEKASSSYDVDDFLSSLKNTTSLPAPDTSRISLSLAQTKTKTKV